MGTFSILCSKDKRKRRWDKRQKTWGMDGCPKAVWLPHDDYCGHIGRDGMRFT